MSLINGKIIRGISTLVLALVAGCCSPENIESSSKIITGGERIVGLAQKNNEELNRKINRQFKIHEILSDLNGYYDANLDKFKGWLNKKENRDKFGSDDYERGWAVYFDGKNFALEELENDFVKERIADISKLKEGDKSALDRILAEATADANISEEQYGCKFAGKEHLLAKLKELYLPEKFNDINAREHTANLYDDVILKSHFRSDKLADIILN